MPSGTAACERLRLHHAVFVRDPSFPIKQLAKERLGMTARCATPSDQQSATLSRDEPGGIEPAIGLAVIRQPVDVPMTDERRIGGIDGRPAADEDDAARKAR